MWSICQFLSYLQETQLNEVMTTCNLDPTAVDILTRKIEVTVSRFVFLLVLQHINLSILDIYLSNAVFHVGCAGS